MFIPFHASNTAGAIAVALVQLGAMSVWVSVLSMSLKAMTALAITLTLALMWATRSNR